MRDLEERRAEEAELFNEAAERRRRDHDGEVLVRYVAKEKGVKG